MGNDSGINDRIEVYGISAGLRNFYAIGVLNLICEYIYLIVIPT